MTAPYDRLVAMAHVRNVARSIEFYEKLGFEAVNTFTPPDTGEPSWAYLTGGGAQLILTIAEPPAPTGAPGILFYLYGPDVRGIHAQVVEAGLTPGPIEQPFYSPLGEFRVEDPDGYVIVVTHVEEPE